MGNLLCRTRYIDDVLRDALRMGLDQVVILGAGFDTRPYRIQGMESASVFEVDHPSTQARKWKGVRDAIGVAPPNVTFVPIDFDREGLEDALPRAGFSAGVRTLFVWEGVTQYISSAAVDTTLGFISRTAGEKSSLIFTYIREGIVGGSDRSPMDERLMSLARKAGAPWVFGIDPAAVEDFLAKRGFTLVEEIGAEEYRTRYLQPLGRKMTSYEGERMAHAQVSTPLKEGNP